MREHGMPAWGMSMRYIQPNTHYKYYNRLRESAQHFFVCRHRDLQSAQPRSKAKGSKLGIKLMDAMTGGIFPPQSLIPNAREWKVVLPTDGHYKVMDAESLATNNQLGNDHGMVGGSPHRSRPPERTQSDREDNQPHTHHLQSLADYLHNSLMLL